MQNEDARAFAAAKRGLVIAAAGCGKTQLIALAVQVAKDRQLILTHTHAGVRALRDRLKNLKVPSERFRVDTIDGWALRYAYAFATFSGLGTRTPPDVSWPEIRECAIKSLELRAVQRIVRRSFGGVYVDEYQDCTALQHSLITTLDDIVGCKIVGDPLQGIFDFGNGGAQGVFGFCRQDRAADWSRDVKGHFPVLLELTTPWRWKNGNAALGKWLSDVRDRLKRGQPLCFEDPALSWRAFSDANAGGKRAKQIVACKAAAGGSGSVVAVHKVRDECYALGKQLKGLYGCVEPLDCRELFDWAESIEESAGVERAQRVIDFAKECITAFPPVLARLRKLFKDDFSSGMRKCRSRAVRDLFIEVSKDNSIRAVERAMLAVQDIPELRFHRRESWQAMMKGLRNYDPDAGLSLRDTVWKARDLGRRVGRPLGWRALGTTLLVKGLEFGGAVVLDADALSGKELYVALTRGSDSLHVLSTNSTILAKL